jgi:tetratricopeptide (TPR) repeat protein
MDLISNTLRKVTTVSHNGEYFYRKAIETAQKGEHMQAVEQALGYLEQSIAADPQYALAWHEKGNCLETLGRCEEAIASYDTALKFDPHNAETWFNKGLVLKKLGKEKEAFSCINKGVDLALGR